MPMSLKPHSLSLSLSIQISTMLAGVSVSVAVAAVAVVVYVVYKSIKPPPPRKCGNPDGPPITSQRIKLSDGRYLSYKERGVPKNEAKFKVILVHGFDSSKDIYLPLSQVTMEQMGVYILTFDRAGYGESDPNTKRSVKSEAFDILQLADNLQVGPKFYVIGVSMGSYSVWACLKYIPHRLHGASLIVPVVNFWWPSFPPKLANQAFSKQLKRDQWKLSIAHHFPCLAYWWMTQKWFPYCSVMQRHPILFNDRDFKTIKNMPRTRIPNEPKPRQQGVYESLHRDMKVHFGKWEFDPMELENPFPKNEGSVYLWQGHVDKLVPYELQRHLVKKLPWIKYHEVDDGGHLFIHEDVLCEAIFRELLLGEEPIIEEDNASQKPVC